MGLGTGHREDGSNSRSTFCEAGQWREILALATAMGGRGITPHSMTCNAVLKVDGLPGCFELQIRRSPVEVGKYIPLH